MAFRSSHQSIGQIRPISLPCTSFEPFSTQLLEIGKVSFANPYLSELEASLCANRVSHKLRLCTLDKGQI
jgi:hypothetical protein